MGQFGTIGSQDIESTDFLFDPAILFISFMAMAVLVAVIAELRGRRGALWFLYGAVAGPVALLHLILLPRLGAFRGHHLRLPPWMMPD